MVYKHLEASKKVEQIIKSFWLIDSDTNVEVAREKIIPDGYPELIFHYEDAYNVNISGFWTQQEKYLIAGQIKNHFFLENTGKIGMFGIKFQPWALKFLFDIDMSLVTNTIVSLNKALHKRINPVIEIAINKSLLFEDKVMAIESWFIDNFNLKKIDIHNGQIATKLIIDTKGKIPIKEILETVNISERSLERYFKIYIGLTPKFYSRIIRFSYIFHLIQDRNFNCSDITFLAGFYDQSHFIKNFKKFTGEEPTKYGFTEENMANFFLNK